MPIDGKTSAILKSLCTTCKKLGIELFAYLRDVLVRIAAQSNNQTDELLPDQRQKLWET